MRNRLRIGAALALPCLGIATAAAQVVTDGTMGPGQALVGPDFVIGEGLGTRLGSNLFHSFADFNVQQGQSATFTSNFAGPTSNVISRVTGGNPSLIDGLLRSQIAGADFWFINPNGLVFGANATLDVPAGFHASTADVLELGDGGSFRATSPGASSLTIAPPSAFGFLDATVGTIAVNGAHLSVANGSGLSLVGGAITLQGGAALQALAGRVDIVALGSAGEVAVDAAAGAGPEVTGVSSFGDITLFGVSSIVASASGAQSGGTVALVGSEVAVFEGSTVSVGTTGAADAGDIVVNASNEIIVADGGRLAAESTSAAGNAGDAGRLTLTAPAISMHSGGRMSVDTTGGAGGRILMNTSALDLRDTVSTQVTADTHGTGHGGDIVIRGLDSTDENVTAADSVLVGLGASIHSNSTASGAQSGQAGSIAIDAVSVRLAMGGFLSVTTVDGAGTDGQGNAQGGAIDIRTNFFVTEETGFLLAGSTGAGQGGDISVQAFNPDALFTIISDTDGAIVTSTSGTGDAGSITLGSAEAPIDFLRLGQPDLPFDDTRGLFSESTATGPNAGAAGSIAVFANRVDIQGAQLSVATVDGSRLDGAGNPVGGRIDLDVGTLQLGTFGVISAATSGAGAGGSITILANDPDPSDARPAIEVIDGMITTSTSGTGDAGDITLGAADAPVDFLWMHDFEFDAPNHESNFQPHGLFSDSTGAGGSAGNGGTITVYAGSIEIRDAGKISASTVDGNGGTIDVRADGLLLQSAAIVASTTGIGDAGDIAISGLDGAMDHLEVTGGIGSAMDRSGLLSTSDAEGSTAGAAGSITVMALDVDLSDAGDIAATTVDGAGGSIDMQVDTLRINDFASIGAGTLGQGDGGQIQVRGASAPAAALVEIRGGNGAGIATSSNFADTDPDGPSGTGGDAGSIFITASELRIISDPSLPIPAGIDASTEDAAGGSIVLAVDRLTINDGLIRASTGARGDAGTISISGIDGGPADLVELLNPRSIITTNSNPFFENSGDAGSIDVESSNIHLSNGGSISSNTPGAGAGGSIHLAVDNLSLDQGATINVGTTGFGNAGNITIEGIDGAPAGSIVMSGGTAIRSDSTRVAESPEELGSAGSISIRADSIALSDLAELSVETAGSGGGVIDLGIGTLGIAGGAAINARTSEFGNAGDINIHGVDGGRATSIELAGEGSRISSASLASNVPGGSDAGAAGNVNIAAGSVTLADGASIDAETVDGRGGAISMDVGHVSISSGALMTTSTFGSGTGGSVTIVADDEVLLDGGQIVAQSTGAGPTAGSAGDVTITAGTLRITGAPVAGASTELLAASAAGEGGIDASTVDGAGGSIALTVGSMTIEENGFVQASTTGAGAGGSISIQADETVLLDGGRLLAESRGTGPSGSVSIAADELRLQNGGSISVRSTGTGRAGSVFTDLGTLIMTGHSQIDATATSSLAGNVELNVSEVALLQDSLISGLSADPDNDGGNFIIRQPQALVLQRSSILANSASGAGGNISITADAIVLDTASTVEATGEVLTTGEVLGNVVQLDPPVVVDAAAALDTRCGSQAAGERSSMVVHATPAGAVREAYLPAGSPVAPVSCRQ